MARLDLLLLHGAINQSGVQFLMSQELLHLFDRHTSGQQIRGDRPPEPVRVCLFDSGPLAELPKHILDSGHGHAT